MGRMKYQKKKSRENATCGDAGLKQITIEIEYWQHILDE